MGRFEELSKELKAGETAKPLPKTRFDRMREELRSEGTATGQSTVRELPTVTTGKAKRTAPAAAGRNQVEGLPSARSSEPYSLGTSLKNMGKKGLHAIAQRGADTLALGEDLALAPFEAFSGLQLGDLSDTGPLNTWAGKIREESEETNRKAQANMEKGGKPAELLEGLGAETIAAVPNAVLAMLTGGGSAAAQTTAGVTRAAAAELSPGVTATISRAVGSMARNPQYWTSFAQVVGGGYEDALAEQREMEALRAEAMGPAYAGADENSIRTKAALYAVGNGLLNAAVEIGGGIETLPRELQSGKGAWRAFVDSMVDEGKEEAVQGVIERAMKNPVYGAETPVFSTTDERAIFNPGTAAREFAGGAVAGGLLGGGQVGIAKALEGLSLPTLEGTNAQTTREAQEAAQDAQTEEDGKVSARTAESAQRAPQAAGETVQTAEPEGLPLPTLEEPMSGQKETAPQGAVNENGLTALTEREKINLSSGKKNKIVSTFQEAVSFIRNALTDRKNVDRAYLGKIPEATAKMVLDETGMDISGYQSILAGDNVRHILKKHGNVSTEAARGQIAVTENDIALIPKVLSSPDRVYLSPQSDSRGRSVLVFEKRIGDKYVTMQAVTDGTHSLQTDTLYIQKTKNSQGTEYYNASKIAAPAHNARSVPPQSSSLERPPATAGEMKASPGQTSETGSGLTLAESSVSGLPASEGAGSFTSETAEPELSASTLSQAGRKVNGEKTAKKQNGGLSDGEETGETAGRQDGISGGGRGRLYDTRAEGETGELARGARAAGGAAEQSRTAVKRQNLAKDLRRERISSRELGLGNGTDAKSISVVPPDDWDAPMFHTAERIWDETGVETVYVLGGIEVKGAGGGVNRVRGIYEQGKRIVIQADNLRCTADQIADHEIFHDKAFQTPGLVREIEDRIAERYGREEFNRVVDTYIQRLRGIVDVSEDATGEEVEAAYQAILEEIYADAYAGINAFGAHAERYQGDVEGILEEKGIGRGRQNAAATDRTTGPPETRFSIDYDENNRPFVTVEEDILDGVPKSRWVKTVKDNLRQKFPDGVTVGRNTVKINNQSRQEMTFSNYMRRVFKTNPQLYSDKLRATNNAGEILEATQNWVNEALLHPRKDAIIDFARGEVQLRVGGRDYTAQVIVGNKGNGDLLLYDIIGLKPTTIKERKTGPNRFITKSHEGTGDSRSEPVSKSSITQRGEKIKGEDQGPEQVSLPALEDGEAKPRFSVEENYAGEVDAWDEDGRPSGETFILGATGEVLQGLGAMEQDIFLRSEKVNAILQKHPEMSLEEIKRIPEILDDPVLVLKSRNMSRDGKENTRLVLFGTVRAENGQPVMAVLDLRPVEGRLLIDDMQKVSSAYARSNALNYVRGSDVLYADERRTLPLLRQFEAGKNHRDSSSGRLAHTGSAELLRSGSMGSITYRDGTVNLEGVPFSDVVGTEEPEPEQVSLPALEDGKAKPRFSVEENYAGEVDAWDEDGRPSGETFILGATGEVLQGLGGMEQDIFLRSEKVNAILQKHPEMSLEEIKRIPEILDDPVLVLKSRNVGRGKMQNTRLVLFGTVRAENGQPVMAVLDLRPVERGFAIDDMQKVSSAYTKDNDPVGYIQRSDILHADKKRTIPLLKSIGFHMPIELQRSGSMGSISYFKRSVNLEGVPFSDVVGTAKPEPEQVSLPAPEDGEAKPRFSVEENYAGEVDAWDEDGRPSGETFILGSTGEVLQGLGAMEQDIFLRSEKVNVILRDHPEMSLEEIKRIPEILDDPVLVLKSKGSGYRGDNTRLVLFGTVRAENGQPVMAVLDLRPVERGFTINDMQKVSSAYTKDNGGDFVSSSEVMYADEKRTIPLLRSIGLTIASRRLLRNGSTGNITYKNGTVNLEGVPFSDVVGTEEPEPEQVSLPKLGEQDSRKPRFSVDDTEQEAERTEENPEQTTKKPEQARKKTKQKKKTTKPAAESKPIIAKQDLRKNLLSVFSIPEGQKAELGTVIDGFADRLLRDGALTQADRDALFDRLYSSGVVTEAADEYFQEGRRAVAGGRVYVDDIIRGDFGDDWNDFRKRAFAAGVYLTNNRGDAGVDVWNQELSGLLPGLFDADELDGRGILERIVQAAEEGKDQKVSLAEYTKHLAGEEYVTEDEILDNMERQMDWALRTFAEKADLELKLRDRTGVKIAQEREKFAETSRRQREREALRRGKERDRRREMAQRQRENRELRELQQRTLKQLQWLSKNQYRAPKDLKARFEETLGDIDLFAVGAANEMNWSKKYGATWRDLAQMYQEAKKNDPNFLPSKDLERIVARLDGDKIEDLNVSALQDLCKAAVGLRTEFYNRNNVINDEKRRMFAEIYTDSKREIERAGGGYTGKGLDKFLNLEHLTPMNVLERMGGWNPNGAFYSMAKQLEQGERDARAYTVEAKRQLEDFLREHETWVKRADGQGKDAVWYELEVPELLELGMGDKPVFGDTVKVYMTPAQKVHLYLESRSMDNLRHMTGGRTFVNRELYSQGKRQEALAQGVTVKLAPETVKKIVSKMTDEEMELAQVLERYYNDFAAKKINAVSNPLYGYDKAITKNYAPIYTNRNYTKNEIGIYDATAEGVGNLKGREYAVNPSCNISAFDAFERHIDQTSRFVGMAIPARNWQTLLNWREKSSSTGDVITHKWGEEGKRYIEDLLTELQGGRIEAKSSAEKLMDTTLSSYISSVFGFNPSIVFKQAMSFPLAGTYLGWENVPNISAALKTDDKLINTYTSELAYRLMGYATPETAQLKNNPSRLSENKALNFTFGGGAITAMDGWTVKSMWRWAENAVRRESPELEMGTAEQIEAGQSPFYQEAARRFEEAVSRSQPMYDVMHRAGIMRSGKGTVRALTLFKTVPIQQYNMLRQTIAEAEYAKKTQGKNSEAARDARRKAGRAVQGVILAGLGIEAINFLNAMLKNGAKYYRDDEDDELTWASVGQEFLTGFAKDNLGMIAGGDLLAEILGSAVTGDQWYGIETPGVTQIQDVLEEFIAGCKNIQKLVQDGCSVAKNGGDLGAYFRRHGADYLGALEEALGTVATYFGGVAYNNVKSCALGALRWMSPEIQTAYEDFLKTADKSGLAGLTGGALETRVSHILQNRLGEAGDGTAEALAALYEAGFKTAVPSDTPSSVSVNGEERKLDAFQRQLYDSVWRDTVGGSLDELVRSEGFEEADQESRAKMLKALYDYAGELAKAEVFDDYAISSTAEKTREALKTGIGMADYLELKEIGAADRYLKAAEAGADPEDAAGAALAASRAKEAAGKDAAKPELYREALRAAGNREEQMAALSLLMGESEYARLEAGAAHGITPEEYVTAREAIDEINDNKSVSQDEAARAIGSLPGLSGEERAVLWQLQNKGWKPERNPFSVKAGKKVYRELLEAAEPEGLSLPELD